MNAKEAQLLKKLQQTEDMFHLCIKEYEVALRNVITTENEYKDFLIRKGNHDT